MSRGRIVFYFVVGIVFLHGVQPASAEADQAKAEEVTQYVEGVLTHEAEFALKSPANKNLKGVHKGKYRCIEGHWRTINNTPVFICD